MVALRHASENAPQADRRGLTAREQRSLSVRGSASDLPAALPAKARDTSMHGQIVHLVSLRNGACLRT